MDFPLLLTVARLIAPLIILRYPLPGILTAMVIDMYDWKFFGLQAAEDYTLYQNWDKALDFYYQLFMLAVVFRFKDTMAKNTAIFLFAFRMIGLLLFYASNNRTMLLYFPNVFENFVLFYLLYMFISKQKSLFEDKKILAVVLAVLATPKIIHEYFQHFLQKQPWEIYNIGELLDISGVVQEYINYFSWGVLLYIIPMGLILYFLRKQKLHTSQ